MSTEPLAKVAKSNIFFKRAKKQYVTLLNINILFVIANDINQIGGLHVCIIINLGTNSKQFISFS